MLTYEVRGTTAWLTLDRPEKLNALTQGFYGELCEALARAGVDRAVRAVVLHGAGKCFSVGGDIAGFGDLTSVADRRAYMNEAIAAFRAVEELPKPTIAAVHGHALGGGCELTVVCDIVVADETARFGMPESAVGLVPGPGIALGRRQVNTHWLKYMIFTAAPLDAQQALLAGLVNAVVPAGEHLAKAQEWADTIAQRSPFAIAAGKAFLRRDFYENLPHVVDMITLLQSSEDHAEGIAAFTEKRAPVFEGR